MNLHRKILAFGILCLAMRAHAALESLYMVDVGVGSPQLTSLEVGLRPLQRWQFGLSVGGLPGNGPNGLLTPTFKLPSQNITLKNGAHVTLYEPSVTTTLYSLCPFIRFFPNPTGFYLQMTLGLLRAHNSLSSDVRDINGDPIPDASYTGTIDATQILPTFSIGHVFASELYFFSLNMGFTIIANIVTSSSFAGHLPAALGGSSGSSELEEQANTLTSEQVDKAAKAFRDQVAFIPSIQFIFGFSF